MIVSLRRGHNAAQTESQVNLQGIHPSPYIDGKNP
jgi:hypothetical protein